MSEPGDLAPSLQARPIRSPSTLEAEVSACPRDQTALRREQTPPTNLSSDLHMCLTHIMHTHRHQCIIYLYYICFYYPTLTHTLGKTLARSLRWISKSTCSPFGTDPGEHRPNETAGVKMSNTPTALLCLMGVQLSACRRPGRPCPRERTEQTELACTSRCLVTKYEAFILLFKTQVQSSL